MNKLFLLAYNFLCVFILNCSSAYAVVEIQAQSKTTPSDSDIIQHIKESAVAAQHIKLVEGEHASIGADSLDNLIIKFKNRNESLSLREAVEAGLLPHPEKFPTINDLLAAAHEEIEDVLPLNLILAVLRSPDNEAIPMLLGDFRKDTSVFTREQIRNPQKISQEKLAQIFDLRRYFIDIHNEENLQEKVTVSLATVLLESIAPFSEVADILLNKMPSAESLIFTLRRGLMIAVRGGQILARINNDHISIANEFRLTGLGRWINNVSLNGGLVVQPTVFARLGGTITTMATSFEMLSRNVPGYSNVSATFFMDAQGAVITGNASTSYYTLMPWYGYCNSWNGFGLNSKIPITGVDLLQAVTGGAFLSMGSNFIGGGTGWALTTDHGTVNAILQYNRSKSREVVIARPQMKYRKDNLYAVTVADNQGFSLQLNLGFSEPISGVGTTIAALDAKNIATVYKTHLTKSLALKYEQDGHQSSLSRLGKSFMTADLPDIHRPMQWKEDDELTITKSGSYTGIFVVGFNKAVPIQVQAGLSLEVRGTYELRVKRLKDSKVEVSINPIHFEEFGVFARIMNFAGMTASHGLALALKQKFIFDFAGGNQADRFDVQNAYFRLIDNGILPNELSTNLNVIEKNSKAGQIIEHFALEGRVLKNKGIERQTIEIIILEHSRLAALVGLSIFNIKFYEVEHIRATGNRIVVSQNTAVESKLSESRKNKTKIGSGQLTQKAFATINTIWENPEPGKYGEEFNNIVLSAEITDTKIVRKDNNRIREELNASFGMDFQPFTFAAQHESRSVSLERKLAVADLIALRDSPHSDLAIAHSQVNPASINEFMGAIRNQGPGSIAETVREFVHEHGIHGFGAIHYLFGANVRDIKVKTTSSIYSKPLKDSENFIIKWSKEGEEEGGEFKAHMQSNLTRMLTQEFFEDGERILADLKLASQALEEDKFMIDIDDQRPWPAGVREDKTRLRNLIGAAFMSVHKLLYLGDLEQNERAVIFRKVHKLKRNIYHRAVIHDAKNPNDIQAGDSQKSLRRRYKESDRIAKDIAEQRKIIAASKFLNDEDKASLFSELTACETLAKRVISLEHISSEEEFEQLIKTLKKAHRIPLPRVHKYQAQELAFQELIKTARDDFIKKNETQCTPVNEEKSAYVQPVQMMTPIHNAPKQMMQMMTPL